MPTPEINHHRWTPLIEHLKNPAELLVLTAATYVGILIGSRLALPALENFIKLANSALK